ncbi:MAG: PspC domain-containing protein [Jatrophihabitantaceae bacterium]
MTTTDSGWTAPPPAPLASTRVLRRSRTDRVGAGVAGGLGEYFGLDPVLFRVLFAVSAFFGGAGVLAYAVAWVAIPEAGTTHSPVDEFIGSLRRRRVPVWLVAVAAGLVLWVAAFSWWAPGPFFPVLAVVTLLVIFVGRHDRSGWRSTVTRPVDLTKSTDPATDTARPDFEPDRSRSESPAAWAGELRSWIEEAKQASRERRRRSFPIRIGVLVALIGTLTVLGIVDSVAGVRLPVYFWVTGSIVLAGLLLGLVLRRTPWSTTVLLVPVLAGMIAFGNTHASLHDGFGQHDWTPTSTASINASYRLAFGQGILDLRNVGVLGRPRTINVTMAAGQVKVLLPASMNATVNSDVRIGQINVDGVTVADTNGGSIHRVRGYNIDRTVLPLAGASGPALTVNVHLADGLVEIDHSA